MILFNCSCGRRHPFLFPCEGILDINSAADEVEDAIAQQYIKDVKEEQEYGWTSPINTKVEP